MAYLARIDAQDAQPIALPALASATPDFSKLEWSIIRLARIDRLWTIRAAGRVRKFYNWMIGRGNPNSPTRASKRSAGWRC
ncbi:hypothetical protein H9L15_04515 [Sphingomonas daechungensis]|uniref:Uncharacterized protein n=1 Tax=Sphingomonas daechungensis TaxID=1176646 RepID=A0ABX6T235_9SPHN|nr:hypothetical protein [Sphingomonas daechungensis]QNP43892.1 hypothetical protein H9L15_04515 [Sphingomonas daechungensis]